MMNFRYSSMMAGNGVLGSFIGLLVIVFLVLGIIYFWGEITKAKK